MALKLNGKKHRKKQVESSIRMALVARKCSTGEKKDEFFSKMSSALERKKRKNFYDLVQSPEIFAENFRELYLLDVTAAALSSKGQDCFLFGSGKQPQEELNREKEAELKFNPFTSESSRGTRMLL